MSSSSNTEKLFWEWEAKKDSWVRYDSASNDKLNEESPGKEGSQAKDVVSLTVQESQLNIDRLQMRQKNITTGFQRAVRCCVQSKDDDTRYCWEWQGERGRWRSYSPGIVRRLEDAATQKKSQLTILVAEQSYTIDLDNMIQINDVSDKEKKVRRIASDAQSSIAAAPAPPVYRTRSMAKRKAETENGLEKGHATGSEVKQEKEVNGKQVKDNEVNKGKEVKDKEVNKDKEVKDKEAKEESPSPGPSTAKRAGPPQKKPKLKQAGDADNGDDREEVKSVKRKVVVKGKAPVDPECLGKVGVAHVYCEGNDIYDVMLNQTNVQNNNNKYYIIQVLEDDGKKRYSVWLRWGRVGFKGQSNLIDCGADLDEAKKTFCHKFHDKTKNDWAMRKKFVKVLGKYDMLEMDYNIGDKTEAAESGEKKREKKKEMAESELDKRVQQLLELICDIHAMEQTVAEMEYDAAKAPLGKVTKAQIKAGYAALKVIEKCIETKDFGRKIVDAVNDYYTRIPHSFGMRQPTLIKTTAQLKKEMELLEALEDIEVAIRMLEVGAGSSDVNPVDRNYKAMNCRLTPMESTNAQYKLIEKYLSATHASTHNTYKMTVSNIFEVDKEGESNDFKKHLGNRKLLWHGSRLTNWYGILSQGLRIAPPEAPVTGYMFGKGVYFADMSSKSANYCFASRSKPIGLVVLADVALGNANELLEADYKADKLPKGCHSTCGLGRVAPDRKSDVTLDDGCVVPCGNPMDTGLTNPSGYTLNYNEYVVYDVTQVKVRYLVQVDFAF